MVFFKTFPISSNIACVSNWNCEYVWSLFQLFNNFKCTRFCPSIRYGFTELTNSISSSFSAISLTISKASSKFPSIETISAPYITACDNLPSAILPSGITTIAFNPARAAYAAAEADVLPVDAQITTFSLVLCFSNCHDHTSIFKRTCRICTFIFYI